MFFGKISVCMDHLRHTIHIIISIFRKGYTTLGYFEQYSENKEELLDIHLLYQMTNKDMLENDYSKMDTRFYY